MTVRNICVEESVSRCLQSIAPVYIASDYLQNTQSLKRKDSLQALKLTTQSYTRVKLSYLANYTVSFPTLSRILIICHSNIPKTMQHCQRANLTAYSS